MIFLFRPLRLCFAVNGGSIPCEQQLLRVRKLMVQQVIIVLPRPPVATLGYAKEIGLSFGIMMIIVWRG